MGLPNDENRNARLRLVEEHVHLENAHDLDQVMQTFGTQAAYDDEPWDDRRRGHDAVRNYYEELLAAIPDLQIEITNRHIAESAVIIEVIITGTHLGAWRGLPATGRSLRFPLCGLFTFDSGDRLAGERIYYDRAGVMRQLGLFYDLGTPFGRVMSGFTHPITLTRAYGRKLFRVPAA